MRVISANESFSSASYKNGQSLLRNLWVFILLLIFVYLVVLFYLEPQRYYWFVILGAVLIFVSVFKNKDYKESVQQIKKWKKGMDGEKEVQTLLESNFDDSYTLITNFTPQDVKIGDIDGILVGPKGLYILEVKKWGGKFRISCADIFKHLYGNHYILCKNIFKQIDSQVSALTKYLISKNFKNIPTPLFVLVEGKVEAIIGHSGIYVCEYNKLPSFLKGLKNNSEFTKEFCDKLCLALQNLN